jgi:Fe2+ transport system protein FeoA
MKKEENVVLLSQMPIGECGVIRSIKKDPLRIRIMEMGMMPGKKIKVLSKSLFKDPIYVSLEHFSIALRENEASLIEIRIEKE